MFSICLAFASHSWPASQFASGRVGGRGRLGPGLRTALYGLFSLVALKVASTLLMALIRWHPLYIVFCAAFQDLLLRKPWASRALRRRTGNGGLDVIGVSGMVESVKMHYPKKVKPSCN